MVALGLNAGPVTRRSLLGDGVPAESVDPKLQRVPSRVSLSASRVAHVSGFNPHTHAWPDGPTWPELGAVAAGHAGGPPSAQVDLGAVMRGRREEWLRACRSAVDTAGDATAKLLTAVAGATRIARPQDPGEGPRFTTDWDAVHALCPRLGPAARGGSGPSMAAVAPWDSDDVAEWFVRNRTCAAEGFSVVQSGRLRSRRRRFAGWWFESGATLPSTANHYQRPFSVGLTVAGERMSSYEGRDPYFRVLVSNFNARALTEMAHRAGLRVVERPPGTVPGERF